MKRLTVLVLILIAVLLAACAAMTPTTSPISPSGVPASPGSGVSVDPSVNPQDLVEASGTVQSVNDSLVRITMTDGSAFDLSFGEHVTWADGVDRTVAVGNSVRCLVKPEPTFTTPNRGDVYKMLENKKP